MQLSTLSGATLRGLPCLFIVAIAILFSAPFGLPGQAELECGLILGTVWYWSLYRPNCMKAVGVFLSGLLAEFFLCGPPGVLLLWMLIAYGVANGWRFQLARGGFLAVWGVFSLIVFGETLMTWALMSLRCFTLLPALPAFFQFCLAAGLYPVLTVVYSLIRSRFETPE
ncbi:hypothetical protein E3E11_06830 [Oecophyllibacter saccharovorans]|uniref:hypothetical protein n=1 Tax=Oecophyllibacter saccharovorans TaxID=2558360 RepID=UPI0011421E86|nr:hypothetical protein [Oecophyllibacter saccharovorans]QDH15617.1 hypothetical protein E3E11_06830 [Oecophyllibacter saccharovorans]